MLNKITGSFLLCEKYDDETNSIVNIFDTLYVDETLKADFAVVLQINIYSSEEYEPNKYNVYTFLIENKKEDGQFAFLGNLQLPPNDNHEHKKDIHSHRHRQVMEFNNFLLPNTGSYSIECYVTNEKYSDDNLENLFEKVRENGELLDTLTFNVQIKA